MNGSERRKEPRKKPKKLTYVALRPDFSKLGKIQDISKGGLCFHYMTRAGNGDASTRFNIDIFISEDGYYLPSIPCRQVYEKKMNKAISHPIGLEYRLCGLQFGQLNGEQVGQLAYYLQHHAGDEI